MNPSQIIRSLRQESNIERPRNNIHCSATLIFWHEASTHLPTQTSCGMELSCLPNQKHKL